MMRPTATPSCTVHPLAKEADEAYFAALDAQRAMVLRKRIRWYCILAITFMTIGVLGNLIEVYRVSAAGPAAEGTPGTGVVPASGNVVESKTLAVSDLALICVYAAALFGLARSCPSRRGLVWLLTGVTVVALCIAIPFEVLAAWTRAETWDAAAIGAATRENTGFKAINAFGLFYCLACILVPMRLHESARIVVLPTLVCVVVITFMLHPDRQLALGLYAMLGVFILGGMAWSWWRYRAFDYHFRAENLRERYNSLSGEAKEISAELSQARRLHEALFPSELESGAFQVAYRYEPMREIGGDFLYVNREQGPGAAGGGVSIVLIDVSGHGIPAALAVNRLHGELQRFFSHYADVAGESGRPGHLLMNLNTYACAALAPQNVYATALVVRFEPASATSGGASTGRLEWASAGHPTAFVRRAGGDVHELRSTSTMLGVIDPDAYDPAPGQLGFGAGDCLLAYTDGAMEARDSSRRDFSAGRIRGMLEAASRDGGATGDIAAALLDAVVAHRNAKPTDDTLIVEVRAQAIALDSPEVIVTKGITADGLASPSASG